MPPSAKVEASNKRPTWRDVKAKLAGLDRAALTDLVSDLYKASPENQSFLHAHFRLGHDPLRPYKETIARWMHPDVFNHQEASVTRARSAIAAYQKAVGATAELAELKTFCCEAGADFICGIYLDDESYQNGLVRTFGDAVAAARSLEPHARAALLRRLGKVRDCCTDYGWVQESMEELLPVRKGDLR